MALVDPWLLDRRREWQQSYPRIAVRCESSPVQITTTLDAGPIQAPVDYDDWIAHATKHDAYWRGMPAS